MPVEIISKLINPRSLYNLKPLKYNRVLNASQVARIVKPSN